MHSTNHNVAALKLAEHIRFYRPKTWQCPIYDVDFCPHIWPKNYEDILRLKALNKLNEFDNRWYIIAAIEDFFNKGMDKV